MQIAYISNRPGLFLATLRCVRFHMPFITEAVVLVPDGLQRSFSEGDAPLPLHVITESAVRAPRREGARSADHQQRNYQLRAALVSSDAVRDEFIMSDDDSRPLRPLSPDFFHSSQGHHSFHFGDLRQWEHGLGSFDVGQQNSFQVLRQRGLPHLSYASHMPQMVDRSLYLESVQAFRREAAHFVLCEWSMYFNYARANRPQRFHPPSPLETLCWPESPLSWPLTVDPPRYSFENYTPSLYRAGGPFAGLPAEATPEHDIELLRKAVLWRRHCLLARRPELAPAAGLGGMAHPRLERILVRPLRRLLRRLGVDSEFRLARIEAELERIRRQTEESGGPQAKGPAGGRDSW